MAMRTSETVELRLKRVFEAAPERVFRAFTEPGALKRWKAPGETQVTLAEVDLKVGGRYRIHMQGPDGTVYRLTGAYREIASPSRLVYTWRWETDPAEKETLVTVDLRDVGGRTELSLIHSRFVDAGERDRHGAGWEGCFVKLQQVV